MSQNTKTEGECNRGLLRDISSQVCPGQLPAPLTYLSCPQQGFPLHRVAGLCHCNSGRGSHPAWFFLLLNPVCSGHYNRHCHCLADEGLPGTKGAHICPCSVNPKQCLVGVTASLRRIWFCHGKGRGFLTSKFFSGNLMTAKRVHPPIPPSYRLGWSGTERSRQCGALQERGGM